MNGPGVLFCFMGALALISVVLNYENLAFNKSTWQMYPYPYGHYWGSDRAVDGRFTDLSAAGNQCVISANQKHRAQWFVDLEGVFSIHHIFIQYRTDNVFWDASNENTGRFLGFSVYISNTTNKEDGVLCLRDTNYTRATIPNPVNITCPYHGRYVIYYNNRTHSPYPKGYSIYAHNELCEFEVHGCQSTGYYGENCSLECPQGCQEGRCHITMGTCLGCVPGHIGPKCIKECTNNTYGQACRQTCGNCSNDEQCDHVNGSCPNGCDAGMMGDKCDTACSDGYYGSDCVQKCTGNCGVPQRCDKKTGDCEGGCQIGWKKPKCIEPCDNGTYGSDCMELCGKCLKKEQCDHINGTCFSGCDPGYQGLNCTEGCPRGLFGNKCQQSCSPQCKVPMECDKITGQCFTLAICETESDDQTRNTKVELLYKQNKNDITCLGFYGVLVPFFFSILCHIGCAMRMVRNRDCYRHSKQRKQNKDSFSKEICDSEGVYDQVKETLGYQELKEVSEPTIYEKIT